MRRWPWEETTFDFTVGIDYPHQVRLWIANPDGCDEPSPMWWCRMVEDEVRAAGPLDNRCIAHNIAHTGESRGLAAVQVKRYGEASGHMIYVIPFTAGESK